MMAQLHRPNIISFCGITADSIDVDHGNVHDLQNLVIDFMPNGDVEHVLDKDEDFVLLHWRSRVLVATQVAEAVEYLHSIFVSNLLTCSSTSII